MNSHEFLQRDLEERKICNRRFGRKKFFSRGGLEERKIWKRRFGKKNFPPRGGLEERQICKSFLGGRILQEELWNKTILLKAPKNSARRGFGRRFKNFAKKIVV
jgi:hypothetical protein